MQRSGKALDPLAHWRESIGLSIQAVECSIALRYRSAMPVWPATSYETWSETCDTLHAHSQVLGKLAATLAAHEPQLQHAALRLTARGWETAMLPAPDGSGALVVALDLRSHEAVAEHSDGHAERV